MRACDSPAPAEGGAQCEGAGQEQQSCKVSPAIVKALAFMSIRDGPFKSKKQCLNTLKGGVTRWIFFVGLKNEINIFCICAVVF